MTHEADTSNLSMALNMADREAFAEPTKVPMVDLRQQYVNSKTDTDLRMSFGRWSLRDKVEWTCLTCTFSNQPLFLTCEMCGQARPPQDVTGNSSRKIREAASGSMASSSQSNSEIGEQAELSAEELRRALLEREEEKLKQERIKEIMALQPGIYGRIHEGTREDEGRANVENGNGSNRSNEETEDNPEDLEDSFCWMDLEDTLPIKDLRKTSSSAQTKGNKFDASNATCTTAASSTSYLSLDGSSHHSYGVRRGTSSASYISLDGSSHHSYGVRRGANSAGYLSLDGSSQHSHGVGLGTNSAGYQSLDISSQNSHGVRRGGMYPSVQEVSNVDGGVGCFHHSFSEFEDSRLSFANGDSSHRSLAFAGSGGSQRSFTNDCSSFVVQAGGNAPGNSTGTSPRAAATSAATAAPEAGIRTKGGSTFSAEASRVEAPPTSMPPLAITEPLEKRLMESCTLRDSKPASRSPRNAPLSSRSPPLEEMPANPRDVPIPAIPVQTPRAATMSRKAISLHASSPVALPKASLPTLNNSEHLETNAFRNSTGYSKGSVILPGNKKVALPPTHNPIFQKNLYSDRKTAGAKTRSISPKSGSSNNNASGGSNKDSSVGAIPILGRMLGRKKNAPAAQFPSNSK